MFVSIYYQIHWPLLSIFSSELDSFTLETTLPLGISWNVLLFDLYY